MKTRILWINVWILTLLSMIITLSLYLCGDKSTLDNVIANISLGLALGFLGFPLSEEVKPDVKK